MSREFKEKTLSVEKLDVETLKVGDATVTGALSASGGVAGASDLVGDPDVNITATSDITIATDANIFVNDALNLIVTVEDVSITSASEIDLVGGAGGAITATAGAGSAPNGTGGAVIVTGGAGVGAGTGGAVSLTAGDGIGSGGIGGTVTLQGGTGGASGEGGAAELRAGNGSGTNSAGGAVSISGGTAIGGADGGDVTLTGGNSGSGVGGDVTLTPGSPGGVVNLASVVVSGNDITSVDEVTYGDALADATAPGRLRRNGAALTFHDGTAVRRLANLEATQTFSGDKTFSARIKVPVIATASLPAAGAGEDGRILIEDAGAGDRNLIIYAGGQRFRIDGGAAF